jgi:hypothetical protein
MSNSFPRIFSIVVTALLTMTGMVAAATQVANAESVIAQLGLDIDGEAAGDRVYSVSLSANGSRVAVGANENDGFSIDPNSIAGHVRIFEHIGNTWVQLGADIDGQDLLGRSGSSVSLSADGNRVAIGASGNTDAGPGSGQVRVFEYVGSSWMQLGSNINGEAAGDFSGFAVSLSANGARLAIGADGNDAAGASAGHVRVFEFVNSAWVQLGADIDGEAADDFSGWSVDLNSDGSRVAIGARGNDDGGTNAGHVRVYGLIGGSWVQVGADINGEASPDSSGSRDTLAISADGNRVAIGAPFNAGSFVSAGHVRVYDLIGGSWVQVGTDIDGKIAGETSGDAVSMSSDGSRIVVGSPGQPPGKTRVYEFVGSDWIQLGSDVSGQDSPDASGDFVAMSGDGTRFAIGSMYHDSGRGNVRVFSISQVSAPAAAASPSTSTLASTGSSESVTDLWIGSTLFVLTMGTAAMVFSRLRQRNNK